MAKKQTPIVIKVERKKGKPRGNPDATIPYRRKKGDPPLPGCGRPKTSVVGSSKLISEGYKVALEQPLPDWACERLGLPKDSTGAAAIAHLQLFQALNLDPSCLHQYSVTELREVTEGKLAEKEEYSGPNGTPLRTGPLFNIRFKSPNKDQATEPEQPKSLLE